MDEHSLCDHWNHVFVASAVILAAILDDTDLGIYVKLVINAMTNLLFLIDPIFAIALLYMILESSPSCDAILNKLFLLSSMIT